MNKFQLAWPAIQQILEVFQSSTGEHQKNIYNIYTFLEMPKRKQLSEEELEEIRNLRGQMPAKQIQTKYGIGSPRLYRIWREATQKQDVQKKEEPSTSNDQLTKIENLLQNMQFDSRQSDAPVDVPEYTNHLSEHYLLLQIHNKVEDMNKKIGTYP